MRRDVRLSRLLQGARVETLSPPGADPEIRGVVIDSRRVNDGDLFCAFRGFVMDGLDFVPEALEHGARAVLAGTPRPNGIDPAIAWVRVADPRAAAGRVAREWHGRPDETVTLVGVTGSNGKTSVVHLVEAMAEAAGRTAGRIGTVGSAHGGHVAPAERTTPEAPELFGLLAEMREDGVALVAMEVSSHALELGRVEGARFAAAAFLNLSRDHLDFHRDMDSYFNAKARLIETLDPDATAVLPTDDPRGQALVPRTRARVLTFGRAERADVRLTREHCSVDGSSAVLETPQGDVSVQTPLLGRVALDNVAAAAACALAVGLPTESIARGAAALRNVPGRMERVDRGQPFAVIVDYAHTEAALDRALSGVRELVDGRLLLVFGCGGERDRGKRPAMGRAAASGADLVYLTTDNPRGEDPEAILREIASGIPPVDADLRVRTIVDRREAVSAAIREARAGDAILVAGKGHESTQVFADHVVELDDRELAREILGAFGWRGGCHARA